MTNEKNVSAQQDQAQKNARFFDPQQNPERKGHPSPPPRQGPETPGSLGWPSSCRLRNRSQFTACYERGRRCYTTSFVLFVRKREQDAVSRFGLTVGRKMGTAVVRNRIKRVVREFFRLNRHAMQGSWDVVIVPKKTLDGKRIQLSQVTGELLPVIREL